MYSSKDTYRALFVVPFLACPFAHANESDPFDVFQMTDSDMKLVTPSLLSVSPSDSPVSITKLHSDDLFLLGIYNVVDAFRLVPGMLVADEFGSGSVVGYHGTNVNVPRRMEVLFNGASIYRPGYAGLNWQRLPLDVSDLSSIEVIRGGSVVDFGSNAFQATVNFVQNPLATMPNAKLEVTAGENTKRVWAGAKYAFDNGQIFARFFREDEKGYDFSATDRDVNDDFTGNNVLINGLINVGENTLFDFSVMSKRYEFEYPGFLGVDVASTLAVANGQLSQISLIQDDSDNVVLKLSGNAPVFNRNVDWSVSANYLRVERVQPIRSCQPAYVFDPVLAAVDESPNIHLVNSDFNLLFQTGFLTGVAQIRDSIVNPLTENDFELLRQLGQQMQAVGIADSYRAVCGVTNTDVEETRYALSGRFKTRLSDDLILSGAFSARTDEAISETYLGGEVNSDSFNLSSSLQYNPWDNGSVTIGALYEDNDRTDSALSYRISYLHHFANEQTIRFTHSRSRRLPDIYETERLWRFFYRFEDGFVDNLGNSEAFYFRTSRSPDNLEAETNNTFEIGYHIAGALNRYQIDAKVFREEYQDMISEPFDFFDFNLTNNGENTLTGFETGGHYQFNDTLKIGFSYLYLDSDTDTRFEGTLFSRHSGSIWAIAPLSSLFTLGTTLTGNSDIGGTQHLRFDATVTYRDTLFDQDVTAQVIYRRQPDEFRTFTEFSETAPNVVRYDNRNQVMLNLSLNF
ncbi:TonB-dependent receptor plug domain-containing protein [Alteromonas macleodii]|uniref:TonB dependent receptor family protein n=1 Tax=Alteromonas macleodii TaxID=28108 RepID=A0AB36FMA8_ALTMA|nr:TonB-dependent receptor [Alteromonas macleodii]OES24203.1 tonB dependent receptor family protein [Alteromonas macleodii]OES24835.1 tonB dependent receptor family protein [Alteromonas macleodii]OES25113.1 tonB dependent receptor family protein [Alteromonas macleodii]OES39156.1 tonB dependent receptor family protein [Alteromonas macleodii]